MINYLVFDLEVIEKRLIVVLGGQAGVDEKSINVSLFVYASVVEPFGGTGDDKWNNSISQAFFEHNKPPHTAIIVQEWMDQLKLLVKVYDVIQRLFFFGIVSREQGFHPLMDLFWRTSLPAFLLLAEPPQERSSLCLHLIGKN